MEINAQTRHFRLDPGEDWEIAFDILDADGTVIDLSAATVEAKIRTSKDPDASLIFNFAASTPITVTVDNEVVLTYPKASTILVEPGTIGYYDVAVTCEDFNNERHHVLEGTFTFGAYVT